MPEVTLEEVLATTDEIVGDVIAPMAEKVDREARWPEEGIRALQQAALGGLVVPERFGGLGHGLLALAQVCERIGRACASTAISFGMHCVGSAVIAAKPTDDQVDRFLAPISRGRHLTTLALSEPGTGSHFYIPQTLLSSAEEDRYVVSGTKTFVTNGTHADSYVISVVSDTSSDGRPEPFSCVILPAGADGLAWGSPWTGLGMRGNDSRSLQIAGATLDASLLLGREGDEMWYVLHVIAPYFLTAMAGTYLGIAAAAFDEMVSHLTSRRHAHSGATLADSPVVQHRVGVLWATLERTRRLIYHAAGHADGAAQEAPLALFTAKAEVADASVHLVNEVMTLMGGIAYGGASALQRHLRDARAAHIMAPTTDLLRLWTGRWLLGSPLFTD